MKLSAVLIVKNEEALISRCLDSLAGVDEVIVCDTGSIDKTLEILDRYPVELKVFTDYTWEDSFCKARNHALSKATGDYIISIDADEVMSPGGIQAIKDAINCRHVNILAFNINVVSEKQTDSFQFPRVFKKHKDVYWKGDVHNHLSVQPKGYIDATITYGYSPAHELDPDRSLRILAKTVANNPGAARERYYLGREYTYKKQWEAAIYHLTYYCENLATWAPEWADGYYILATAYRAIGEPDKAKNAVLMALKINMDFRAAALLMASLSGPINAAKWTHIANIATNERVLFSRSPVERDAGYYDKLFAGNSDMSRYAAIHNVVGNWANEQNCLDIGCGTAELQNHIKYYHGIDFSAEAVKIANKKTVTQADIYTADLDGFETYIICEVLEHIDDKKLMARLPKGKNVIVSVPSFTDPSHVRTYDKESMLNRLGKYMDFDEIVRFNWHTKWVAGGEATAPYILLARGTTK